MLTKSLLVVALSVLSFVPAVRAATPIEFEFSGVFTQTTGTVHTVGAPFTTTVLFDPATPDTDPSGEDGSYKYLSWTVPGTSSTPFVFANNPRGGIRIDRGSEFVDQWHLTFSGAGSFNYSLLFEFVAGTFTTDALPLNLNISQAINQRFIGADTNFDLRGTINTLTVRVVPEPGAAGAALCCVAFSRCRRKR